MGLLRTILRAPEKVFDTKDDVNDKLQSVAKKAYETFSGAKHQAREVAVQVFIEQADISARVMESKFDALSKVYKHRAEEVGWELFDQIDNTLGQYLQDETEYTVKEVVHFTEHHWDEDGHGTYRREKLGQVMRYEDLSNVCKKLAKHARGISVGLGEYEMSRPKKWDQDFLDAEKSAKMLDQD